jgi:hypothetical protein
MPLTSIFLLHNLLFGLNYLSLKKIKLYSFFCHKHLRFVVLLDGLARGSLKHGFYK